MKKIYMHQVDKEAGYKRGFFIWVEDEVADLLWDLRRESDNRARRRRRNGYTEVQYLDVLDDFGASGMIPSAEETFLEMELRENIMSAIETLPPKQRRRIYLRFYLDMRLSDIGSLEGGIDDAAVKRSIDRGLGKLKFLLKGGKNDKKDGQNDFFTIQGL